MSLSLNRPIPYTQGWKQTVIIGSIVGGGLSMLLIFLQPFDTDQVQFNYKVLKLAGYGLCFLIPILVMHPIENALFKKQQYRWYILNELGYIIACLLLVYTACYFYNTYIVNNGGSASLDGWRYFMIYYGLPFMPFLGPLWLYFRNRFGKITLPESSTQKNILTTITGENKKETLTIAVSDFVYAQAQQNYVAIHYLIDGNLQKEMMRSTLSNIQKQVPDAWQVHRSYLVNLAYLKTISGNSRKRELFLTISSEAIPVSQKYYEALQKRASNSSQK
ncbi:LytTR family DNA-binding domain-containing protein [uncultured Dokdonia sp.]|uniref:LytR/AlgR family response regulator transcription factor n=1 Tax=uncultured Dokdonia sp. TaxID=575653 RepID=UPI002617CAB1|nr:LytTR family DNA-binding domain-containing protein [uncultured Dokdonia sp.]